MKLAAHLANVYSQHGEDGALAKLFDTLGVAEGYFVEFGAWDGQHLSNTYAMIEKGWSGCYIEGDEARFQHLCLNVPEPQISKVREFVTTAGPASLDAILDGVGAPEHFELLSIDIDSDDLAVWRAVRRHRAKCVVIEYNPTIPFDCEFENPPGKSWGNSALSICRFAESAEYALVCVTKTNLVFLDESALRNGEIEKAPLSEALLGSRWFWGYDGSFLCKSGGETRPEDFAPELYEVPWTRSIGIQPIPKRLRVYSTQRSAITIARRSLGLAVAGCLRPISSAREALDRWRRD